MSSSRWLRLQTWYGALIPTSHTITYQHRNISHTCRQKHYIYTKYSVSQPCIDSIKCSHLQRSSKYSPIRTKQWKNLLVYIQNTRYILFNYYSKLAVAHQPTPRAFPWQKRLKYQVTLWDLLSKNGWVLQINMSCITLHKNAELILSIFFEDINAYDRCFPIL